MKKMLLILGIVVFKADINAQSCPPGSEKAILANEKVPGLVAALQGKMFCGAIQHYSKLSNTIVVTGTVYDTAYKPIPYATITAGNKGVTADSSGAFRLLLPHSGKTILDISAVGYTSYAVPVSGDSTIEVVLQSKDTIYCSVVVTTPGWTRCRSIRSCCGMKVRCIRAYRVTPPGRITVPIKIFPNPAVRGSAVSIKARGISSCTIRLLDNQSKLLQMIPESLAGKDFIHQVRLSSAIPAGIYYVVVTDSQSKKQYTEKLVIQ